MQQLVAQYLLRHGSQPTAWLLPLAASSLTQVVRLGLAGSSHNSHHRQLAAQAEPAYKTDASTLGAEHLLQHHMHEQHHMHDQPNQAPGLQVMRSMTDGFPHPLFAQRPAPNAQFMLGNPISDTQDSFRAQQTAAPLPASTSALGPPHLSSAQVQVLPSELQPQHQPQQPILSGEALTQYQQYCALLSQYDPNMYRNETELSRQFKAQMVAELQAAKDEQQRHTCQLQQAAAAGVAGHMRGPSALHRMWLPQLRLALDAHLAQARQLALCQHNATPAGIQESSALLWPALIHLGTEQVADVTLKVLMRHVLLSIAHEGDAADRAGRPVGAGALFLNVAVKLADALLDAVRFGTLQDFMLQERALPNKKKDAAGTSGTGKKRLQKLLAVLEAASSGRSQGNRRHIGMLLKARDVADGLLAVHRGDSTAAVDQHGNHTAMTWPREMKIQVGTELLALALQTTFLPGGEPALHLEVHKQRMPDCNVRMIQPTPSLVSSLLRDSVLDGQHLLDSRYKPMRIPPRPWTRYNKGGLLLPELPAVRVAQGSDTQHLWHADKAGQLDKLKHALNTLGSTPWRINRRVLSVLQQLGSKPDHVKAMLGVPDASGTAPIPRPPTAWGEPSSRGSLQAGNWTADDSIQDKGYTPYLRMAREGRGQLLFTAGPLLYKERVAYERQAQAARMKNINILSLAMEHERRVNLAAELAVEPRLYQPHSVDFRGRAYPLCVYLHHQGDDMQRSLLEFADGRPLGQHGFRWLLIQLANCYGQGVDKLSLQGRVEFGEGCIPECKATAADPWSSAGSWWQKGDDPWQLLATALEVAAALDSGDPASYVSHLPIHQDGSCNGLQHYAAMARDYDGAVAVNVVPRAEPQDVYAAVARAVEATVKEHAATDHRTEAVKLLQRNGGVVDRKLVKQTVMTTVYGVTFIGARDQIRARLMERGWQNENEVFQVSSYLATVTLASVSQVFATARPFMTWLAQCASCLTHTGKPVAWTAPVLGFPIKQPYFKTDDAGKQVLDRRAQRTAFPPNFIHSVDAAHMMMTALACKEAGVEFAGVHDSFFTHAGTVGAMNDILRRTFVELHAQPLLQNLAAELKAQGAVNLPPIPKTGTLDLNSVLDSTYFFS